MLSNRPPFDSMTLIEGVLSSAYPEPLLSSCLGHRPPAKPAAAEAAWSALRAFLMCLLELYREERRRFVDAPRYLRFWNFVAEVTGSIRRQRLFHSSQFDSDE